MVIMPTLTPEQLKERYNRLPPDVQDAYFSVDTAEILQKIGKENNLNINKIGILADETGLLMLGIISPSQFIPNLAKRLEVNKEIAKKIAHEVNEKIFSKIRESLRKIHKTEEETEEKNEAPIEEYSSAIPKTISPQQVFKPAISELEQGAPTKEKTETPEITKEMKQAAPSEAVTPAPTPTTPTISKPASPTTPQPNMATPKPTAPIAPKTTAPAPAKATPTTAKPSTPAAQTPATPASPQNKPTAAPTKKPETAAPTPTPAPKPGYGGSVDPYREPVN